MRILFVVPYVPSLVRVRPYNLIRFLAARGHHVTLATVWTNAAERNELQALESSCVEVRAVHVPAWRSMLNCLVALASGEPLQARYSWSTALAEQVESAKCAVDVVHVEHLRGALYALSADRGGAPPPVVWDSVDCISHLFAQAVRQRAGRLGRLVNRLELGRTRRLEGQLAARFERVLVTSSLDRAALLAMARQHAASAGSAEPEASLQPRLKVLTNGVDLDYFTPSAEPRDPDMVVFSGKMSYHANESAALHLMRDIMPRVWCRRPATRLVIVGKEPTSRLRRLVALQAGRVTLTDTVPDMRPYLRRAAVAVVPVVYAAGCQNKVLEAMACATPVVATPQAVSALQVTAGKDVEVAEGAPAFAETLVRVLDDGRRQRALGAAGREYVERHHRWTQIAADLEKIYEELLPEAEGPPEGAAVAAHAGTGVWS